MNTTKTKQEPVNLQELAAKVHDNAVKHGWWEKHPSDEHCLMLVISELAEAIEADRKGRMANVAWFEKMINETPSCHETATYEERYAYWFETYIKDTLQDELADTVIRLLDLAGAHCYNVLRSFITRNDLTKQRAFTENVWEIVQVVTNSNIPVSVRVILSIEMVDVLANTYGFNLWWYVEKKMEYNISRPYKHGKKY